MENSTIAPWVPAVRRSFRLALPLLSGVVAMAGCGGGGSPVRPTPPTSSPPPQQTTQTTVFKGTVAGARQSGTLEVTLQAAVAVSSRSNVGSRTRVEASGSLLVTGGGGHTALGGTYDDSKGQVTLSGGGFSLAGQVFENGTELSGSYTDPSGAGGTFSTLNTSVATVSTYCGTWAGSGSGTWNMALGGGLVGGTWSNGSSSAPGGILRGTLEGTKVSGEGFANGGGWGTFEGALQGSTLSGTWRSSASSDRGTFDGSTPCQ